MFTLLFVIHVFPVLPPSLDISVTVLDYQSISVSWSYTRQDFYTVTNKYSLTVESNGAAVKSEELLADKRAFNVTGLQAETVYGVSIMAITTYGNKVSKTAIVTTPGKFIKISL